MDKLIKDKLKLADLRSPNAVESKDYSNIFRQSRARTRGRARGRALVSKMKKREVLDNIINVLDEAIENLDEPKKDKPKKGEPWDPSGPGERFAIAVKEEKIKNMYDNIDYLNNKLKNNNLKIAEYKKISDETDQIKKKKTKKEQELYEAKKKLEKRIRTDQARSF